MATWALDETTGQMIEHAPDRPANFNLPTRIPFRLILVTHDESTFYANDQRKNYWQHASQKHTPQPKTEGSSIMASEFMTSEWGRLTSEDGKE
jgi:hypothetical protein